MFGYVTFYKDELKIKDFNKFKAYYCGLCKELGKRFNQLVRLGLSYDFTFLALILDSLDETPTEFAEKGCFKHIGKKRSTAVDNLHIGYAADMSVAFMYFKLLDDIRDDFSIKAAVAVLPYIFAMRRVRNKYPEAIENIRKNLRDLSEAERRKCDNIDEAAHPFALIMESLFGGDENLRHFGYCLGRFIYIADAANDYEKDVKKDKYNPFRYAYYGASTEEIVKSAEQSMLFTLAMLGERYEKLNIVKNKELLENIIYMGLRHRMETICFKAEERGTNDGKSL